MSRFAEITSDRYLLDRLLTNPTDAERETIANARGWLHEKFKDALYSGDDDTVELVLLLQTDPGPWELT